jgi:regulatory protein
VTPAPRSLKARALQWLALHEHSRSELQRKLLAHARVEADAVSDDAERDDPSLRVTALLDWLEANRYLSQERFVESRVNARAPRHGNLRIRQELAQHGVVLGAAAAQALELSEFERARDVWARRFGGPAADAGGRARQARFLTGRGFSSDVVRRVLREAARPSEDDAAA